MAREREWRKADKKRRAQDEYGRIEKPMDFPQIHPMTMSFVVPLTHLLGITLVRM